MLTKFYQRLLDLATERLVLREELVPHLVRVPQQLLRLVAEEVLDPHEQRSELAAAAQRRALRPRRRGVPGSWAPFGRVPTRRERWGHFERQPIHLPFLPSHVRKVSQSVLKLSGF